MYNPTPHERPTWDLTSALYAVQPDRGFFGLSEAGTVTASIKTAIAVAVQDGTLDKEIADGLVNPVNGVAGNDTLGILPVLSYKGTNVSWV